MLHIRMDKVLPSILFLGLLFNPLSGSGDEGSGSAPSDSMRALYWSCVNGACEPASEPDSSLGRDVDDEILLGYIKGSAEPGTAPLYWACAYIIPYEGCGQHRLVAQPRYDDSVLLGYIAVEKQPGTVPLYWRCKQRDSFGECVDLAPDKRGGAASDSALLGYVYVDR